MTFVDKGPIDNIKFDIKAIEKEAIEGLLEAANDEGDWTVSSVSDGIEYASAQKEGFPFRSVRGRCEMPYPPDRIMKHVENLKNWANFDENFNSVTCDILDENHKTLNSKVNGMFPVAGRITLLLQSKIKLENGWMLACGTPYDDERYPSEEPDWVRCDLPSGGWHITQHPEDPNKSKVVYFVRLDPRMTYIPAWLYNLFAQRFPMVMGKVRDFIAKDPFNDEESYEAMMKHEKEVLEARAKAKAEKA